MICINVLHRNIVEVFTAATENFDGKLKMHGIWSLVDHMQMNVKLVNVIIMVVNKWINFSFQSFDHYTQVLVCIRPSRMHSYINEAF